MSAEKKFSGQAELLNSYTSVGVYIREKENNSYLQIYTEIHTKNEVRIT